MYRLSAIVLLAAVAASEVRAGSLTYNFSGAVAISGLDQFPLDTPFSGTITLDTSAVVEPFSPTINSFSQSAPPGNLTLTSQGMVVQSTIGGIIVVSELGAGEIKFDETFSLTTIGGAGWDFDPNPGQNLPQTIFGISFAGSLPTDLGQLPTWGTPATYGPYVRVSFSNGLLTFPGGTVDIQTPKLVYFGITNLTLVPEPSTYGMAAIGIVAMLFAKRKNEKRVRTNYGKCRKSF